jgi:hypothetical protein
LNEKFKTLVFHGCTPSFLRIRGFNHIQHKKLRGHAKMVWPLFNIFEN